MTDPVVCGNLPPGNPPPVEAAVFDRRLARVAALATLAAIFAGIAYSRESGFTLYAVLFAVPYAAFVLAHRRPLGFREAVRKIQLSFSSFSRVTSSLLLGR